MLRPLGRSEVAAYVRHRLAVAGREQALFSRWAEYVLWRASRGLPRLVNIIAAKAMMLAYGQGTLQVRRSHVMAAARDTLAVPKRMARAWALALLGLSAAAAAGWRLLG
jgi:MSHA biogenesis protein MshM